MILMLPFYTSPEVYTIIGMVSTVPEFTAYARLSMISALFSMPMTPLSSAI